MKATFIKDVSKDFQGEARLYQINDSEDYFIASAVSAPFSGPEVLCFPATAEGNTINMLEFHGERGTLNIDEVVANAERSFDQESYDYAKNFNYD